jgi:FKBP-type peptidyl-prolyl cis-trans isomerase
VRRLTTATAAAAVAAVLLLAGCSGSGSDGDPTPTGSATSTGIPTATAADVAALDAVKVEGDLGKEPKLTFKQPFSVTAPVARVDVKGTGTKLKDGQVLTVNYVAVNGKDGSSLGTTYGADPQSITLGSPDIIEALNQTLKGQKIGARVLLAVPAQEMTLMSIEVVDARTIPTRAEGEPVAPVAGLPTVTLAKNGEPSITPVKGAPPADLKAQPLIKGAGPAVEAGQTLTLHYTGWLWDGTEFDSSWDGAPFSTEIGSGKVIPGWDQGLVGQTVGSQVLLVVPPALGYGDAGSGDKIPGDSTLVFVVDILDAS